MKGRQHIDQVAEQGVVDLTGGEQLVQHALGGQAYHLHGVLQSRAVAAHAKAPIVATCDRHHAEVHVPRQATVEPQLFVTEVLAPGQGREVEEAQVHGLLDLVDTVAHEEEQRAVGLTHRDGVVGRTQRGANLRRVGRGLPKPREQFRSGESPWAVLLSRGHGAELPGFGRPGAGPGGGRRLAMHAPTTRIESLTVGAALLGS